MNSIDLKLANLRDAPASPSTGLVSKVMTAAAATAAVTDVTALSDIPVPVVAGAVDAAAAPH